MDSDFIYTGPDYKNNWLYNQWYRAGGNARYMTWQLVLNILNQRGTPPIIIETGCQRHQNDIGDGASTTIFCEYVSKYGGKVISVDISEHNIRTARKWTEKFAVNNELVCMDSVKFLKTYDGPCDLLYLDSYDYPIGPNARDLKERENSQNHNLEELKAIYDRLQDNTIVLFDDNRLPGGGKPKKAKEFLVERGWACLLDFQQSVWIRKVL